MGKEDKPAMTCSKCGNTLSPSSTYCTACGASVAAPATPTSSTSAAPPASAPYTNQPLRARTAFYGRYGMRGNTPLPAPSSLTLTTTRPHTDEPKGASLATAAAPPAAGPSAEPAAAKTSAAPAPAAQVSEQTKSITISLPSRLRRPASGRLIALGSIALLVVLLVSLSTFGYHAYKKNEVETRATATADARIHATSTAAAQATATAATPLFTDLLATNTNGWLEKGATAFFAGGQYHLHNSAPTLTLNSYYQGQTFDNFKVEITVTAHSDATPNADVPYAYGLVLRANPTSPGDKYVFFVSPAGTYNFARHDADGFFNNGWTDLTLTPWTSSNTIHKGKGATNYLAVIARENTFTLIINGETVEIVTDTFGSFASGWIGVMVEGADMEASFSNMQVYRPNV